MVRFELGRLLTTPSVFRAAADEDLKWHVDRHACGDWGVVDRDDWRANDRALVDGTRLLSAYVLRDGKTRIRVIPEADRSATTILLLGEY